MTQRRRHRRFSYRGSVQIVANGRTHTCLMKDLSHGGARVDKLPEAQNGDLVKLFVELPIPHRERARFCCFPATIAWSADGDTGLEFDDVSLETFAQLEVGIDSLSS